MMLKRKQKMTLMFYILQRRRHHPHRKLRHHLRPLQDIQRLLGLLTAKSLSMTLRQQL
jgi:hypothetical protein